MRIYGSDLDKYHVVKSKVLEGSKTAYIKGDTLVVSPAVYELLQDGTPAFRSSVLRNLKFEELNERVEKLLEGGARR